MLKRALVVLAEGFEEIEAITVIDVLRRAKIEVGVAGLKSLHVRGSRQVEIVADQLLKDLGSEFDAIIFPGGMPGAANLGHSDAVKDLIKDVFQKKKWIAAICASPSLVLAPTGILEGKAVTGYPGMVENFSKKTVYREDSVVVDGNVVTSRGPGTALAFALKIAELLSGKSVSEQVRSAMLA